MPTTRRSSSDEGAIELVRLQEEELAIAIKGVTPIIPHKWSEKAKAMMPGHPKRDEVQEKKGKHLPEQEAEECLYRLGDGRCGMPATAFKAAMIGACGLFEGITKVNTKLVLHVVGEGDEQLVPIAGTLKLREDTPRNANGGADLRYRYMIVDWSATVRIRYIPSVISARSIVALLDAAGKGGIGDWRPSAPKSATGTYGRWEVVSENPLPEEPAERTPWPALPEPPRTEQEEQA
jgi:hypothetical protein